MRDVLRIHRSIMLILTAAGLPAFAQDFDNVVIQSELVRDNVYMLTGAGGNLGLSVGANGCILIDDQFAPLTSKIVDAVKQIDPKPVRFLINTHYHFDHTGGNENFGKGGSIIVAHENVRQRLSKDQFIKAFKSTTPAMPKAGLPVITFTESMTFHWNDEDIEVIHVAPAHTDGDSIIYFHKANVIHTGDVYFNGIYPFIDVDAGGSLSGMVAAVDRLMEIANPQTKFIPGHGPLSGMDELRTYRRMLTIVADRVEDMIKEGKTREQVIAAKPTGEFDTIWGDGFLKPDVWVGIVYDGMAKFSEKR